jgi:hypothetical protein
MVAYVLPRRILREARTAGRDCGIDQLLPTPWIRPVWLTPLPSVSRFMHKEILL